MRVKLDSSYDWISPDRYPLDNHRLVLNGHDKRGNGFVLVWDWRKNELRTYQGAGSHASESISGISVDEKSAASVPSDFAEGLLLHDLQQGSYSRLKGGMQPLTPRYSPDGTRLAFFSEKELILRRIDTGKEEKFLIPIKDKLLYPKHLAWSPSGRLIAGAVFHGRTDLVVWDSDGKVVKVVAVGRVSVWWPPIWAPDETGVYMVNGNEWLVGRWEPLGTEFIHIK